MSRMKVVELFVIVGEVRSLKNRKRFRFKRFEVVSWGTVACVNLKAENLLGIESLDDFVQHLESVFANLSGSLRRGHVGKVVAHEQHEGRMILKSELWHDHFLTVVLDDRGKLVV